MKHTCRSHFHSIAFMLLASLSCQAGGESLPASKAPAASGLPDAGWVSLRYSAKGMTGSVSTSLILAEPLWEDMLAPPYTALDNTAFQTKADHLMLLIFRASAESLFGGYSTEGKIWFDGGSGAVLQRDKLRPGRKGSRKIYRFGTEGASRIRLKPMNRVEAEQPSEDWSRIKESFYPYDIAGSGCDNVSEPALLLYLLPSMDLGEGKKPVYRCLFFDDALYRVWLEPDGSEMHHVDYSVKSGGVTRQVSGEQETLKVSLRVEPITEGADSADFELLELRGDIAIHLDAVTRLPVILTGERSGLGRLTVGLVETVLRD